MMKKFLHAALALVLLLAILLQPAAMAADLSLITEYFNTIPGGFDLKEYVESQNGPISIGGFTLNREDIIILDDCVVGDELEVRVCKAAENALVLDEHTLPAGCKTETRKEKKDPDDPNAKEESFLYLVGKPTKAGSYLFIVWTDRPLLCMIDVLKEKSADSTPSPNPTPQPASDIWTPGPAPLPIGTPQPTPDLIWTPGPAPLPIGTPQPTPTPYTYFTPAPDPTFYVPTPAPTPTPTPTPRPNLSVSITGDTRCRPGETVVLEAGVSGNNGAALLYQWYASMGPYSGPIEGANASRYIPDTSQAGVWTYYCIAGCYLGGSVVTAQSNSMTLTVAEVPVSGVEVERLPNKTSFLKGDRLDTTGLRLLVTYSDGSRQVVTDSYTATPTTFDRTGTQTVWITYNGRSCGYTVTVTDPVEAVTGIGLLTLPTKTSYKVGEQLNTAGLSIRAYMRDGSHYDVSSGLEVYPIYLQQAGEQTITVRYANRTCSFHVNVEEELRITGISLVSLPVNRSYIVGDTVNTTGLTLQVYTNRGTQTVTSGFTWTPRVVSSPGTQTITVLYGNYSDTFTVSVSTREAPRPTATPYPSYPTPTPYPSAYPSPTPLPMPTMAPTAVPTMTPGSTAAPASGTDPYVTATQTPAPVHTSAPARRSSGVNGVVKLLFIVALLSLAGLIGFIVYLRRNGGEDDGYEAPRQKSKGGEDDVFYDMFSDNSRKKK